MGGLEKVGGSRRDIYARHGVVLGGCISLVLERSGGRVMGGERLHLGIQTADGCMRPSLLQLKLKLAINLKAGVD